MPEPSHAIDLPTLGEQIRRVKDPAARRERFVTDVADWMRQEGIRLPAARP